MISFIGDFFYVVVVVGVVTTSPRIAPGLPLNSLPFSDNSTTVFVFLTNDLIVTVITSLFVSL